MSHLCNKTLTSSSIFLPYVVQLCTHIISNDSTDVQTRKIHMCTHSSEVLHIQETESEGGSENEHENKFKTLPRLFVRDSNFIRHL